MMDSLEGETEDSRTSAVGRKRDLAEVETPQEHSSEHSDDSVERSRKRARQEPERAHSVPAMDEVIAGAPLPSGTGLPATDVPQIPSTDQQALFVPPPMTWNKGVQSGLRTSFGSSGLSLTRTPTPIHKDAEGNTTQGNIVMEPQIDAPRSSRQGRSGLDLHDVVELKPPAQPEAQDTENTKTKSKKARKKAALAYGSDLSGVKTTTEELPTPNLASSAPRDPQLPNSHLPRWKCTYENGRGEFVLDEVLQDNQQVRLPDLTGEVFANHFLAANSEKLDSLVAKNIKGAFSIYINHYYKHLRQKDLDKARASSTVTASAFNTILLKAKQGMKKKGPTGESKDDPKAQPKIPTSHTGERQRMPNGSENGAASNVRPAPAGADHTHISKDDHYVQPLESVELEREDGEMSPDAPDVALSDLEIELLQKYFPTVPESVASPTCLACASSSHTTFDCPSFTCNICGKNHLVSACPGNFRCLKCRARGHQTKDCPEKLFRALSETDGCDLCQSRDHLENACHLIWRSYNPKPEEIRAVRDIPVSCYVCGASNHYGPECGLHSGKILSGGVTWSKSNLQKYLDPSSSDRAICAGTDFSLPNSTQKIFSIKGKANDPIMLDDSDDDVEFIRPSVRSLPKSQPRGTGQQIHFAPNRISIQEASSNSHHAHNPPRQSRQRFGDNTGFQDSARYLRDRTFSPPPRFGDFRVGFDENGRYLPQTPARGEYRPPDGGRRPGQGDNNFRGGQSGRGRAAPVRGGGNGRGKKRGKNSK